MDARQASLIDDLAGIFRGDLSVDPLVRGMYATDGSLFQLMPLAVAAPRDCDDVVSLVKYAAEMKLPVVARGSGSNVGGESLGDSIIIDFSRHMRQIVDVGSNTATVQPGVVLHELNRRLRPLNRYFPPDPSAATVTTIGGMLAVDSAGSRSIRVGSTRDHVERLSVVLASGEAMECGKELLQGVAANGSDDATTSSKRELVRRIATLLGVHRDLIVTRQPKEQFRNRAGYFLRGVLGADSLDLPRLLVGSEGTLALFTEAVLQTAPLPAHRAAALLAFRSMEGALTAVQLLADEQPSACDLVDQRLLSLARELDERFAQLLPVDAGAALIIEQTSVVDEPVRDRLPMFLGRLRPLSQDYQVAYLAQTPEEVDFLWSLPSRVVPMLNRLHGPLRPIPLMEDIAVPPAALSEFVTRAQKVFQRHEATASFYAHAAAGQVHMRPFAQTPAFGKGQSLEELARDLYQAAIDLGGSISGEHGLGLSRTAFLRMQYGPLYRVFQEIKQVFDPQNLLNPGKVLSNDPHLTIRHFRPEPAPVETIELQRNWTAQQATDAAAACNGCGACKSVSADGRMCPLFKTVRTEAASPRAKANLMRLLLTDQLESNWLGSESLKEIADLCFNCKQCVRECPTQVDVPGLMLEAKAQFVASDGLPRADWYLTRLHRWAAWARPWAAAANPLLRTRWVRWLLERTTGLSARRRLPALSSRSFLQRADRRWLTPPANLAAPKPVIFFVDYFVEYHDPELGEAFAKLLEACGCTVHIPPQQTVSGMPLISAGDIDAAAPLVERNIRALAEFARAGCPIVCTEPSAAICLKTEYPRVSSDPDAEVVASCVVDAATYLSDLHRQGRWPAQRKPVRGVLGYHTPCHTRALNSDRRYPELCRTIPELTVHAIEAGCSGMAGVYGLSSATYESSMEIGAALREATAAADWTWAASDCSACRLQMATSSPAGQSAAKPVVHPVKLLAASLCGDAGAKPSITSDL